MDQVAVLLRAAGPRVEVPAERSDRVLRDVLGHWREEVRRRRRRRWTVIGLAASLAVAAVGLGALQAHRTAPPPRVARVEALDGEAWLASGARDRPASRLRAGATVAEGAEVASGTSGRVALRLGTGHSLRLDVDTRVRLGAEGVVDLEHGAVYVDSGPGGAARSVRLRTPLGTVREVGTQFEARLEDDGLRIRVREGSVRLAGEGLTREVPQGTDLHLSRGGAVTQGTVSPFDARWSWTTSVTPMIEIRGRALGAFLAWAARERGWTLDYASQTLARSAADIVLSGSVDDLSVEEALDAVLPTCRMTYRVEDGRLEIAALGIGDTLP